MHRTICKECAEITNKIDCDCGECQKILFEEGDGNTRTTRRLVDEVVICESCKKKDKLCPFTGCVSVNYNNGVTYNFCHVDCQLYVKDRDNRGVWTGTGKCALRK